MHDQWLPIGLVIASGHLCPLKPAETLGGGGAFEASKGKQDSDQEQRLFFWLLSRRLLRLRHQGGNNVDRQND
jgi:hypothetical protein